MGAGTCEQIAPLLFTARRDGTWAVREDARFFGTTRVFDGADAPEGRAGRARVPAQLIELAYEAAEECPGECIHIEE
jgi:ferredoxin